MRTVFILVLSFITFNFCSQVKRSYKKFADTDLKAGDIILAPEFLFELGSCQILPQSKDSVNIIADFVKKHRTFTIEIGVHTDSRGKKEANILLSKCRAESILSYLTKELMLPARNFETKGYGSTQLLVNDEVVKSSADMHYDKLRLKNRRVEIKILKTE